jgi:hypothetical protein
MIRKRLRIWRRRSSRRDSNTSATRQLNTLANFCRPSQFNNPSNGSLKTSGCLLLKRLADCSSGRGPRQRSDAFPPTDAFAGLVPASGREKHATHARHAARPFLRLIGYDREDVVAGRLRWTDLTPPEWLDRDERRWLSELKVTGSLQPLEKGTSAKTAAVFPC